VMISLYIGYEDQGLRYTITMYMWSFHYSHGKNQD
jgi:hypothetical protein